MYASHWCFDKRFNFRNMDDGHCVVFGFCVYATWAAAQMEPADAMAAVPWMHAIQKYSLMTATKTTAHGCNTLLVTVSKSHSVCEWMGVTAAGGTSHRGWQLTKLTSATMPVSLDCVSPRLFRLGINMSDQITSGQRDLIRSHSEAIEGPCGEIVNSNVSWVAYAEAIRR